jgi:hypothetical protein
LNPINLKTLAAGRFRITLDEVALIEPGGKKDPWYLVIPCRHGQIYPYSDTPLAIHSKGSGIRRKLQAIDGLTVRNWSDDGEAIFLFGSALFDRVAEIVKPKRKRRLSDSHKAKLIEAGSKALKAYQKSIVNAPKHGKKGRSPAQAISWSQIKDFRAFKLWPDREERRQRN